MVSDAARKEGHDERSGVASDADWSRWQGGFAAEKGHRQAVLKKVVVGDEGSRLAASQRLDNAAHPTWSRLDRRDATAMAQMYDRVKEEARCCAPGDNGHGDPMGC